MEDAVDIEDSFNGLFIYLASLLLLIEEDDK
jgi:lipid-A-disaccharide synthase-like uncharacterized protein